MRVRGWSTKNQSFSICLISNKICLLGNNFRTHVIEMLNELHQNRTVMEKCSWKKAEFYARILCIDFTQKFSDEQEKKILARTINEKPSCDEANVYLFVLILYLLTFEIYDGATSGLSVYIWLKNITILWSMLLRMPLLLQLLTVAVLPSFFCSCVRRQLLPKRENDPMFNRV